MPSDAALLADILIASKLTRTFVAARNRDDLVDDLQLQFAVRRGLEIVGEAARLLSEGVKAELAEVPWRDIIGMRHRLIHDYARIDLDVVWQAIDEGLPALIAAIEPYLARVPDDE
jgi:uncharacterized protein with HEPN domain